MALHEYLNPKKSTIFGKMEHLPNLASYQDMLLGNLAGCHGSTALQDTSLESLGHALYDDAMNDRETQWLSRRKFKKCILGR